MIRRRVRRWLVILLALLSACMGILLLAGWGISTAMCATTETMHVVSPSGRYRAEVSRESCGAMGANTSVWLVDQRIPLAVPHLSRKAVFTSNGALDHTTVRWDDAGQLVIDYDAGPYTRIRGQESHWRGATVSSQPH